MPTRSELLRDYVFKHYSDYQLFMTYEAGCCGYYPHRCFESCGWNSLIVNPADVFLVGARNVRAGRSRIGCNCGHQLFSYNLYQYSKYSDCQAQRDKVF